MGEQRRRLGHAPPDAGDLQGDPRQRQDRPAAPHLDRHVARPAVQPARRRRPPRERPHRADLHDELLRHQHGGGQRGGPDALLAQHPGRQPTGSQTTRSAPTSSATSGTRTSTTAPDHPARSGSRRPGVRRAHHRPREQLRQGPGTHAMTMYRHPGGGLVFGAGTIQWAWGLDTEHDRGTAAADVAAQQATVNLLADMGAQPTTLRPGLVAATASTDTAAPTSTITSPAAGATVPDRPGPHRHRHRRRHRRGPRRRRRGLHRQRHDLAPGHRARDAGPTRSRPPPTAP